MLQILLLLLYFSFPGPFRNKLPSSRAMYSLDSPPKGRIFLLLLLLLVLLLLILLVLLLLLMLLVLLLLVLLIAGP